MRGKITAAAGVLAVLLAWVGPGVGARDVFEDKFAALDPAWGLPSNVVGVKDGKLVVSPETNQSQTLLHQGFLFPSELEIRVSISFVKADDDTYGSGLVFWANDYWDYYALLVNAQGWFAVQRYFGGSYGLPVPWRESDVIKKGIAVDNLLRVATKGDQVTVYINGQELVT